MKPAVAALLSTAAAVTLVACGNSDSGSSQTSQSTTTTTTTARATASPTATTANPRAGATAASDGSFTVVQPKGWESKPAEGSLIQLIGPDGSNMAVQVNGTAARGRTVQESAEMGEKNVVNNLKGTIDQGGVEATTVDKEPAWRFTYTVPGASLQQAEDVRGRSLYVRHRDIEYLVTFSSTPAAFGAAVADYEAVMQSWKWSE